MKQNLKQRLMLLAVGLVLLHLQPPYMATAHAQAADSYGVLSKIASGDPDGVVISADNADTALLVKYVGSSATAASGSVASTQGTSLVFAIGASGSEAADASVKCPGAAAAGTVDVTNAACDTLGEVVDVINATSNWRAVILDGLRSDSSAKLLTAAATAATSEDGLAIKWTTAQIFSVSYALGAPRVIGPYLSRNAGEVTPGLVPNPYAGRQQVWFSGNATSTYASGTSNYQISSCAEVYSVRTGVAAETCTPVFSIPGGATTVNKLFNGKDYSPYGILTKKGQKMLVRLSNSAAASAVQFVAYGGTFRY